MGRVGSTAPSQSPPGGKALAGEPNGMLRLTTFLGPKVRQDTE